MKKRIFYILFLALLHNLPGLAQQDTINYLEEVVLSDVRLYENSRGNRVRVFPDSVLVRQTPSLTSVLKFNTPLHFKENGPGMVSSVSFRGTSASQTAVVWNGININSRFTGQTDFNTILTSNYDHVALRSGGGSVLYGSGAIAGSVHLNNRFSFDQGFSNQIRLSYGSFDTFFGSYSAAYSSERTSVQIDFSRHSSENDFPYPGTGRFNENGDYGNTGISAAVAHLLNDNNSLRFYTNFFRGQRGFSGTLTAPSNSKYEDVNSRNLFEWKRYVKRLSTTLKLAYLDETYRFYESRKISEYSGGRARTGIVKYDLDYRLNPSMSLSGIGEIKYTRGTGENIGDQDRATGSVGVLFEHSLQAFRYEISGRQEFSGEYRSPLLFSVNGGYEFSDRYAVSINFSRNYRIPTLNDLYWYAGGNNDLKPEHSLQAQLKQDVDLGNFDLGLTFYAMELNDLLRWVPDSDGLWKPVNTQSVRNFGLEALVDWEKKLGHHKVHLSGTYAFTDSRDMVREKQLTYVPRHKGTSSLTYTVNKFSLLYQFLYTGSVFVSSDNEYILDGYKLSNIGLHHDLLPEKQLSLAVEIRNLWDETYQSMPSRPMAGRAFFTSITFKY